MQTDYLNFEEVKKSQFDKKLENEAKQVTDFTKYIADNWKTLDNKQRETMQAFNNTQKCEIVTDVLKKMKAHCVSKEYNPIRAKIDELDKKYRTMLQLNSSKYNLLAREINEEQTTKKKK